MKEPKTRNLVAKHARKFNKAAKHVDRKKALKRGYAKHDSSSEPLQSSYKVQSCV